MIITVISTIRHPPSVPRCVDFVGVDLLVLPFGARRLGDGREGGKCGGGRPAQVEDEAACPQGGARHRAV